MNRILVVFLSVAYAFTSTVALSIDSLSSDSDGLIRVPLTPLPRKRRAAEGNGLTKIEMDDTRDVRYGFPMQFGTPPQTFNMVLDSGSVDLWVPWKEAKDNPNCGDLCEAEHYFDETASSTFQKGPGDFYFGYKGGSTEGIVGVDTVTMAGLTAKNQPFGLAKQGIYIQGDGVLGFSYVANTQIDNTTHLDRLKDQGQIQNLIGCVKMRQKKVAKSEMIIGGCDVEADAYAPVIKINGEYTGWRLNLTKIILRDRNNNSELLTIEPNYEAVLDTGAADMIDIPTQFMTPIAKLMNMTPDGAHHQIDCDRWEAKDTLPIIEFYFGDDGAKVVMDEDVYSWKYYDSCQVALSDNGDGVFLIGTILFNSATVIFDRENNQIGFKQF